VDSAGCCSECLTCLRTPIGRHGLGLDRSSARTLGRDSASKLACPRSSVHRNSQTFSAARSGLWARAPWRMSHFFLLHRLFSACPGAMPQCCQGRFTIRFFLIYTRLLHACKSEVPNRYGRSGIATACCTATPRTPHQRRDQPAAAARPRAGAVVHEAAALAFPAPSDLRTEDDELLRATGLFAAFRGARRSGTWRRRCQRLLAGVAPSS